MRKLLLVVIVLAACERVVDLTPDATFAMQPDTSTDFPDAAIDDDANTGGDGDASSPPPDASVLDAPAIDAF